MKPIVFAAAFALLGQLAWAEPIHLGTLSIDQAWARSTAATSHNGAAYLSISNQGKTSDRLLSVSSKTAEQTQLHRSSLSNGVMHMAPVDGGVEIAPGKTVKFAPGGLHVMLIGLKQPLKNGDHFPLTLHFQKSGEAQLQVEVRDAPTPMPGMEHMQMN